MSSGYLRIWLLIVAVSTTAYANPKANVYIPRSNNVQVEPWRLKPSLFGRKGQNVEAVAIRNAPEKVMFSIGERTVESFSTHLIVDCSDEKLYVYKDGKLVRTFTNVHRGRNGFGMKPGSGKTPLGSWTVREEPWHGYGPALRLQTPIGETADEKWADRQGRRGILVHRDLNSRVKGSRGCIHLRNASQMRELLRLTNSDTVITIRR